MPDYARLAATASRLIESAGIALTLARAKNPEYDATTGEVSDSGTSSYSGFGVRTQYRVSEIDGTRVRMGDARLYVTLGTEPKSGDALELGTERWTVLECLPLNPGGTVLLYELQVRRP